MTTLTLRFKDGTEWRAPATAIQNETGAPAHTCTHMYLTDGVRLHIPAPTAKVREAAELYLTGLPQITWSIP